MSLKKEYLDKIDAIPAVSFNHEQKAIAKKILEQTAEKDLHAVYGLITQRVKTGFVFDEAPEVNHDAVALAVETPKLNIEVENLNELADASRLEHKLIIGENYDALKNLCATYIDKNGKGLIDLIYIDPPYNTEATQADGNDYKEEVKAQKFIYRDKFTRDGWLNMMNERLKLAKRLLSDKGVIFISIDDSEQAYLKVLCDEIFGEENCVACVAWQSLDTIKNDAKYFSDNHEYILVYAKRKLKLGIKGIKKGEKQRAYYKNFDDDPRGDYLLTPLHAKSGTATGIYSYTFKNGQVWSPPEGTYPRFSKATLTDLEKDNRIYLDPNGVNVPQKKTFYSEVGDRMPPVTFWSCSVFGSTRQSNKELSDILGKGKFPTPKPLKTIKTLIDLVDIENPTVLDFFAGSGTTGQAVMELNEEDGGKRRFILVTNNENGIGEKITRERLYRVICGKGSKDEKIAWRYSDEKPCLSQNSVRVFGIESHELTLKDLDKAEKLKAQAAEEFKKLNPTCEVQDEFDLYNELAALNPLVEDKIATSLRDSQ